MTTNPKKNKPYNSIDERCFKRAKVWENGCQKEPEVKNTGEEAKFYAVGFADMSLPQSLYLRASVLACPKTVDCKKHCQSIKLGQTLATQTSIPSINFVSTTCGPRNGKSVLISGEKYCASYIGSYKAQEIAAKCNEINAKLPVPECQSQELDIIAAMRVVGLSFAALGISDDQTEGNFS